MQKIFVIKFTDHPSIFSLLCGLSFKAGFITVKCSAFYSMIKQKVSCHRNFFSQQLNLNPSVLSKFTSYRCFNSVQRAQPFSNNPMKSQFILCCFTTFFKAVLFQQVQSNTLSTTIRSNMTSDYDKELEVTCRQDSYKLLPMLKKTSHKGQAGRIGIVGGSVEFSGAPYYAGMSALRAGADLVYIFTVEKAAPVIKSYSPDLMVLPFLDKPVNQSVPFLGRLHTLVIGPGLGRDDQVQKYVLNLLIELNKLKGTTGIPLVIDADGIHLLLKNLELFKNYTGKIYITPNVNEFKILYSFLKGSIPIEDGINPEHVETLFEELGEHFTIIVKGPSDLIVNVDLYVRCTEEGALKRCGGQGDILSGVLGSISYWAYIDDFPVNDGHCVPEMLASYIACMITRKSANKTFKVLGRSMEASDILNQLPLTFKDVYGSNW